MSSAACSGGDTEPPLAMAAKYAAPPTNDDATFAATAAAAEQPPSCCSRDVLGYMDAADDDDDSDDDDIYADSCTEGRKRMPRAEGGYSTGPDDDFTSADEGAVDDLFTFGSFSRKLVTEAEEFAHMVKKETGELASKMREEAEELACKMREEAGEIAHKVREEASEIAHKIYEAGWRVVHHTHLPEWLRDNEFLHFGHRPELGSFIECFKSIFKIHTETGNIWTHLIGMLAFVVICTYFLLRPSVEVPWHEKFVLSFFFVGAITCLGFSTLFHTVYCHSKRVGKLFNKLDYCGITFLIVGSFVPWLYYSFYCRVGVKVTYLLLITFLGAACIVLSLWEKFSEPKYRALRASVFVALGLSGIIPATHYVITDGLWNAVQKASLGYLLLMAFLYILGAVIYAVRIPERLFPGKFDIWFQSHQIFHVLVVAGAVVHFLGIMSIAYFRLNVKDCPGPSATVP